MRLISHQEAALEIDADDVIKVLLTHIQEVSHAHDASIRDEDVNAPECRHRCCHQLLHLQCW